MQIILKPLFVYWILYHLFYSTKGVWKITVHLDILNIDSCLAHIDLAFRQTKKARAFSSALFNTFISKKSYILNTTQLEHQQPI